MTSPEQSRQLASHLQTVLELARGAEKKNPAVEEGLTPQELRVLSAVGREKTCIMSKIASAICLSLSSCTGLIDRLVEKRLVCRDRDANDRRVVSVSLTAQGEKLHESAQRGTVEFARGLLEGLEPEEQEALVALLGKVSKRIEREKAA